MKEAWQLGKWPQMSLAGCHQLILETWAEWCMKNAHLCSWAPVGALQVAVITSGISHVPSLKVFSLCMLSECRLKSLVSCGMDGLEARHGPICAQGEESHEASVLMLVVHGLGRSPQRHFPPWCVVLRKFLLYWLQPSQLTCFALGTLCRVVIYYLFK